AAALAGAGAAAGAQEAPDTTATQQAPDDSGGTASSVDDSQSTESTAPADDATTTTEAAGDQTTTTEAAADDTTTTAADNGADDNGNINNLPLNSGIQTGTVFNPVPYGEIPGNTPQVLIQRPGSGRIVPLNREITIRARFKNFTPGFFSDPKSEYGLGTQRLDGNGNLQGHNHGCFQRVARDGSVPADTCDSFVVLSQDGTSDVLTGIMPPLTQPGRYRLCVDAAAENHYPAARAFAQRGGPVDCVRVLAMDFNQLRGAQPAANANQ
ncbi:MAG: hypothetical protein ACJ75M_14105, partial [Actinomycetes bacterium]